MALRAAIGRSPPSKKWIGMVAVEVSWCDETHSIERKTDRGLEAGSENRRRRPSGECVEALAVPSSCVVCRGCAERGVDQRPHVWDRCGLRGEDYV